MELAHKMAYFAM